MVRRVFPLAPAHTGSAALYRGRAWCVVCGTRSALPMAIQEERDHALWMVCSDWPAASGRVFGRRSAWQVPAGRSRVSGGGCAFACNATRLTQAGL